ncbi:MAG: hypothetical protein COA43_03690 [Robiginitomaculum sp.]|nr:MAG: hypothetical protein COA43_03690 [Robiginitomaculum sp.]
MAIDEETAALLGQLNSPEVLLNEALPNEASPIVNARAGADIFFSKFAGENKRKCSVEDLEVNRSSHRVPIRIYHPKTTKTSSLLPIIVFFHGGGWSLGDVKSYDSLVSSLCDLSEVIYISVDYRLAPECKFPTGLNDCLAVTEWALAHGAEFGGDTSRIAVMGDSAGGNFAAVIAYKLNVEKPNQIKAQFLLYPVMDNSHPHDHYNSRMVFGNGEYLLSRDGIDAAVEWHLNPSDDRADPTISPGLQNDLNVLPPTVIIVGGYDPLLDEVKKYHSDLKASGVSSILNVYETTIHAFLSFGVLGVAKEARRYLADQVRRLL